MNLSKLTKANLIIELEKRSLPTNGLKDELVKRLKEAIEIESAQEVDNQEENYNSEDESEDKSVSNQDSNSRDKLNEILYDDEIVKSANNPMTVLTVDDAINMKSQTESRNYSMIVNIDDDDDNDEDDNTRNNIYTSTNNNYVLETSASRDIDNGEHEVIEISEEIVIDDDDNQENDNNFNDDPQSCHNEQSQQDKDELESGESREDEVDDNKAEKINLWVYNVAEDVKAVELKELFGKYGNVISAKVVMNGKDATGNCFGCIELSNNDDVENCMKHLDKTEFRGNTITISKNICDLTPKEIIQRNISPISSTDSWGGGGNGKNKEKTKSLSPFTGEITNETKDEDDDTKEQSDNKCRAPYRGRGGYRGNNYGSRDYSRNDAQESHGTRGNQDYRRGNYGSRSDKYSGDAPRPSYKSNNYESDTRPRDNYQRREMRGGGGGGGGRDDCGGSRYESRYQPMNKDRHSSREAYNDRPTRSRYHDDDDVGRSGRPAPSRYGNSESHDYDKRSYKRPSYNNDRPRDSGDYNVSSRRDEPASFKRPRMDNDDFYMSKRRRDDYSPLPPSSSRDVRYRMSPKRTIYSEKEIPHRSDYHRDRRDNYPSERLGQRDYAPASRRTSDYVPRAPMGGGGGGSGAPYSPDRSRSNRSTNYGKEPPYPAEFGGRSRNYDR